MAQHIYSYIQNGYKFHLLGNCLYNDHSILNIHQMTHLSHGFMGDPTLQLYTLAKSSLFISGPLTL